MSVFPTTRLRDSVAYAAWCGFPDCRYQLLFDMGVHQSQMQPTNTKVHPLCLDETRRGMTNQRVWCPENEIRLIRRQGTWSERGYKDNTQQGFQLVLTKHAVTWCPSWSARSSFPTSSMSTFLIKLRRWLFSGYHPRPHFLLQKMIPAILFFRNWVNKLLSV